MVDQQVAPEGTAAPAERRSWRAAIAPYATPLAVGALVVAATAYFAVVDPNQPGHFPACPLRATTGLDCPACGGLRAVHALCHGELGTALDQNLLVTVVLLPLAVISWLLWLWRSRPGRRPAPTGRREPAVVQWGRRSWPYALITLLLVFTVVRNLPFVPYLRSGIG